MHRDGSAQVPASEVLLLLFGDETLCPRCDSFHPGIKSMGSKHHIIFNAAATLDVFVKHHITFLVSVPLLTCCPFLYISFLILFTSKGVHFNEVVDL